MAGTLRRDGEANHLGGAARRRRPAHLARPGHAERLADVGGPARGGVAAQPADTAAQGPWELSTTRVVDARTLQCTRAGRPVTLLHSFGVPKPWQPEARTSLPRTAYLTCLRRLLTGDDLAIRTTDALAPWCSARGTWCGLVADGDGRAPPHADVPGEREVRHPVGVMRRTAETGHTWRMTNESVFGTASSYVTNELSSFQAAGRRTSRTRRRSGAACSRSCSARSSSCSSPRAAG